MDRRFDRAYSTFDALNHLTEPAELEAAFRTALRHLHAGDGTAVDLNTPEGPCELSRGEVWEESGVRRVYGYDLETRLGQLEAQVGSELEVHLERGCEPQKVGAVPGGLGYGPDFYLTRSDGRNPGPRADCFLDLARASRAHPAGPGPA